VGLNPLRQQLHSQPVTKQLDKIQVLHVRKFCRPTSGVGVLEQSRYSASIVRVLVCKKCV